MIAYSTQVLEQYQVRKTKKQKTAFIDFLQNAAREMGYESHVEKGSSARNVVVGNPETAKVVYTAHYDTCVRLPLPNLITPRCLPVYILYQLVISLLLLLPFFVALIALNVLLVLLSRSTGSDLTVWSVPLAYLILAVDLYLFFAGPANPHTANDNTSGVTTLLEIMAALAPEKRGDVAFIFFDLEELGLVGSGAYFKKHKKAMKQKLLINFDCVSDGDHMILALQKGAREYAPYLEEAFRSSAQITTHVFTRGVIYPSDQSKFPRGVGVAALRRQKHTGLLYLSRIHTKRDTIYQEENIAFLTKAALRLPWLLPEIV